MKDKSAINLRKSMGRGSVEHETNVFEHEGDIMTLAKKKVISIPPSTSIIEAAETMVKHKFRRLPITDPGSEKLLGIVTAMDILNFLGGGDKFNIMEEKYHDNFLAAINEHVKEIMTRDIRFMRNKDSINDCIEVMLAHDVGALPVVNDNNKVVGIVTERDFALTMAGILTDELVEDFMTKNVITTTPGTPIESSSKIMVRNKLRRIPILGKELESSNPEEEKLVGIVTSNDVLKFLGDSELFSKMRSGSGLEILNTKSSEIMERNVCTVGPLTRVGDLCELLNKKDIGGVPVIKDGKLLGIITESDVLKAIHK
ncbi:hypoxic response protein 1 [Methanobrevibacter cuticularis]|uniref:Hypoxic response protein 1 n=1 Tax=Methanobrevibacter cuticularis TaxID=47311 RepID=A0A166FGF0_9EURY|nr:CBS domain-containing protein [Methanobrevibacter cuticularis]KZX17646.1 hypoxic response protein 1 [Methanobrevibacter cuticularis]